MGRVFLSGPMLGDAQLDPRIAPPRSLWLSAHPKVRSISLSSDNIPNARGAGNMLDILSVFRDIHAPSAEVVDRDLLLRADMECPFKRRARLPQNTSDMLAHKEERAAPVAVTSIRIVPPTLVSATLRHMMIGAAHIARKSTNVIEPTISYCAADGLDA